MLILGIDPGLKGGLAFLLDNTLVGTFPMPTCPWVRGKPTVDALALDCLFAKQEQLYGPITLAVLEQVHAIRGDAVTSAFSFGHGTGIIRAVLMLRRYPLEEPAPQQWMKEILAHRTHDKPGYIAYVQQRFPEVNLFPGEKKKKTPHDGIAAAVCLAEYGRRLLLGKKEDT